MAGPRICEWGTAKSRRRPASGRWSFAGHTDCDLRPPRRDPAPFQPSGRAATPPRTTDSAKVVILHRHRLPIARRRSSRAAKRRPGGGAAPTLARRRDARGPTRARRPRPCGSRRPSPWSTAGRRRRSGPSSEVRSRVPRAACTVAARIAGAFGDRVEDQPHRRELRAVEARALGGGGDSAAASHGAATPSVPSSHRRGSCACRSCHSPTAPSRRRRRTAPRPAVPTSAAIGSS